MKLYPKVATERFTDLVNWARDVTATRQEDVRDFDNLNQKFVLGRNRTLRNDRDVPTGSSDVVATDAEGDIMHDASYLYILINNSGTLVWRRCALSSW